MRQLDRTAPRESSSLAVIAGDAQTASSYGKISGHDAIALGETTIWRDPSLNWRIVSDHALELDLENSRLTPLTVAAERDVTRCVSSGS